MNHSKRIEIQSKLREFMEKSNGKNAWDKYQDSQLEEEIVKFTIEILKQHGN
jgi:hypothetical protein